MRAPARPSTRSSSPTPSTRKYYRKPAGRPTSEVNTLAQALRPLHELYGHTDPAAFGPLALKTATLPFPPTRAIYAGREPYYFNGGIESVPVTLFYDGHVAMLGLREAIDANLQAKATGGSSLWHPGTPMGDYWHNRAYTPPGAVESFSTLTSSFHIMTRFGIRGRDTFVR